MGDLLRAWAKEKLEGIFPEEGYQSDSLAVIKKGDLDFDAFHKVIKSRGYEISNGYGDIKKQTFRVGTMGDLTPADIRSLIGVMDEALEEVKQ